MEEFREAEYNYPTLELGCGIKAKIISVAKSVLGSLKATTFY